MSEMIASLDSSNSRLSSSCVSDAAWGWEVANGIKVLCAWAHTVRGDLKPCELNGCKGKLVRVEGYAVPSAYVKPVDRLVETAGDVICP